MTTIVTETSAIMFIPYVCLFLYFCYFSKRVHQKIIFVKPKVDLIFYFCRQVDKPLHRKLKLKDKKLKQISFYFCTAA